MKQLYVHDGRLCKRTSSPAVGVFISYVNSKWSNLVYREDLRPVTEEEQSWIDKGDSFASIERRIKRKEGE